VFSNQKRKFESSNKPTYCPAVRIAPVWPAV